ncbi:MAG: coenzyme F420-0:L-glutamate ligase [Puniceicoccales bacterium]|jgi:putative folate metabolism gamma-glutamate ligase|nr:coenzyme F420-0:L-glutamate ligase [Puniceicoccales bacterium]
MHIKAIKSCRVNAFQDLNRFVDAYLPMISEESIVVVTSKVVSICEGRTVPKHSVTKEKLIQQEADLVIANTKLSNEHIVLTLKNNLLIPSAGIDESNGNDAYVLYPKDCFASAKQLWSFLRTQRRIQKLGILITDSHTTPLRKGVTGIALAWWGFDPLFSYVGKPDLYGYPLRVTYINTVDALAASAAFLMGEGDECTPLAMIENAPHMTFNENLHTYHEVCIAPEEDLYQPLLKSLSPEDNKTFSRNFEPS